MARRQHLSDDGDRRQARATVNHLVESGRLPRPNDEPCTDCGHEWALGERRHEYDHHRGYGAGHHRDVEPVCTTCHHATRASENRRMTKIEWTRGDDGTPGMTWNPAVGCTHISPGCDHCYAATVAARQMQPAHQGLTVGRKWNDTVRLLPERLDEPLRWRKPRRVFVGSMTDLFHDEVPPGFIANVFNTMARADRHTFQVLTKRPQRMRKLLSLTLFRQTVEFGMDAEVDWPLGNVWAGTSIENDRYLFRARHLAATPAAVRFLSVEPLIGPVDLTGHLDGISWVIVGAESGPGRRHCSNEWVRTIRDQCADAGTRLFVKQLQDADGRVVHDLDQFPDDLRIREWP